MLCMWGLGPDVVCLHPSSSGPSAGWIFGPKASTPGTRDNNSGLPGWLHTADKESEFGICWLGVDNSTGRAPI